MRVRTIFFVEMTLVLFLCSILLAGGAQTLTIDSQLGTSIEDCFERISIGEQLPYNAIYRNVSELTTRECEQICKQDKQCQIYDYGVGAKGNATCNLSKLSEKELKDLKLRRHPDYDIFTRRIQCEQSPPSPQPQYDEPLDPSAVHNDGPVHRPVFRPVDDEPRRPEDQHPLADDIKRPQGLSPYDINRPGRPQHNDYYKPYNQRPQPYPVNNHLDDRPDDYGSQKPDFDQNLGYGQHRPQDIPFQPDRPIGPPPPMHHLRPKPDPYDVLNFQDPYVRPPAHRPGLWRPDPYFPPSADDDIHDIYGPKPPRPHDFPDRPIRPIDEKPEYHYIVRPNRRPPIPRPQEDFGYRPMMPYGGYPPPYYDSGYGQNDPIPPIRPIGPPSPPLRPGISAYDNYNSQPARPFEKPSYNYNSQYASGYGQNSHYDQGNSIYLQIRDPPPRPHKPVEKPLADKPSSGYGGQNEHGTYPPDNYGQGSHSHYGHTAEHSHNHYIASSQSSGGYGQEVSHNSGYGQNDNYEHNQYNRPPQDPIEYRPPKPADTIEYRPQKPSYGSQTSYGETSSNSNQYFGQNNYGGSSQNGYDQIEYKPQKPQDHYVKPSVAPQPIYGNAPQEEYGSSYGSSNEGYGSQNSINTNQGSYGSQHISSQSGYGSSSYGSQRPSDPNYDRPDEPYGNKPAFEDGGYKSNRPTTTLKPAYTKPIKPKPKPIYGERPDPAEKPGYGNTKPDVDEPSYGKPIPEKVKPSYGNPRPVDKPYKDQRPERPLYTNTSSGYDRPDVRPVYEYEIDRPTDVPSYIVRPDGQVITSRPVAVGDYGEREPAYGVGRNPGHRVNYEACYRRVLAGKRALRSHVRRVLPCEQLEHCRRECALEKSFHCESFNYKLDPSFRGKGLCELMTKPIEAFDIQRDFVEDKDFDFFELDRNSLEPDCQETLRGAGMLHSGYLSSKPNHIPGHIPGHQKWDRFDKPDHRIPDHHDRFDGHGQPGGHRDFDRGYDRRRPMDHGHRRKYGDYVPFEIGLARSSEDDESWGQYGGSYGGSKTYYKDRGDFQTSLNHWRLSTPKYHTTEYAPTVQDFDYNNLGNRKHEGNFDYGHWRRSHSNRSEERPGLTYGESNYYRPRPTKYYPVERSDDPPKDCTPKRRPGMSLGSGAIRRSLRARNVVACETACFNEKEFKCVSYSYRYSTSHGSDNCFLSERPYRGVDLASDSDSDVYAMPADQGCVSVTPKPWIESECFWHVRSEAAVSGPAIKASLTVAGLGACEAECIRANGFFCRGFSFRYDAPKANDDLENCLLTPSPPTSLEPDAGLSAAPGHEMYSRGNYGRGCEPALYDHTRETEKHCYLQYDKAAKLIGPSIKGHAHAKDQEDCGRTCTNAPFKCLSYSFNSAATEGDNCLMSEVRLFDLQRGVDYEHSRHDALFATDLFNTECTHTHTLDSSQEFPRPISLPPTEEHHHPPRPAPSGSGYLPSGPVGPEYGGRPSGPSYIAGSGPPSAPSYKPTGPPSGHYKPSGPPDHYPPGPPETGPGYKPSYPPAYQPYPSEPSGPSYPEYRPALKPGYPGEPYLPGPSAPGYRPSYLPEPSTGYSGPSGPAYKPSHSGPEYRPDPVPKPGYPGPDYRPDPVIKPGYPGPELRPDPGYRPGFVPSIPSGPSASGYERPTDIIVRPERPGSGYYGEREEGPIAQSWRHYTVSGLPCRRGTTCAQNPIGGHWACEPEGGEIGSWDYCCAPTHRCGYSEGFHKPWCFVGREEEQWRPCSDKYYPYHQHNVPHPSLQGDRDAGSRPAPSYDPPPPPLHPSTSYGRPAHSSYPDGPPARRPVGPPGPYLPQADRRYWDNLYKDGPQAYYDKYGNPLPGYVRVPTASRPHIKYQHRYPPTGGPGWEPVSGPDDGLDPPMPGGLGAPRYWPVAYLHKGPPPNMTYFRFNETQNNNKINMNNNNKISQQDNRTPISPPKETPAPDFNKPKDEKDKIGDKPEGRKEKTINGKDILNINFVEIEPGNATSNTTPKIEIKEEVKDAKDNILKTNASEIVISPIKVEEIVEVKESNESEEIKGIDGKLDDFTGSLEVIDLEEPKGDGKPSDIKTLEAEEAQIAAIGRFIASQRGGKLVLEKRSQKELEAKKVAVDEHLVEDFNFGNRFATSERKGKVQKITKEEIEKERELANDKSLEVSETTFVRPPRVLSTLNSQDNVRKALVNGKVFYDATVREQRDLFPTNNTRKNNGRSTNARALDDMKAPSILANTTFGKKKTIRARNVNPVRRVRRIYRKRYNPDEVRRRLLERERIMKQDGVDSVKQKA